jgi:hypothetical protein
MQLLVEVPLGYEEANVPSILGKSSAVMSSIYGDMQSKVLFTLIAGSPSFFCRKVGTCMGKFSVLPMLYRT